ncbi:uncharacterized protein LOC121733757 [Aricia agestis]|uniref:uncharacterized protein LOC121733757 n=1 Tax=Aricia agestis TaxID=91739 RepID=UPI001C2067A5|nr:uncharacterized protein LOC121733757 [Aricia agestis]
MLLLTILAVLMLSASGDSQTKGSGIAQFWADDYKVFDQIYGRTSDKHLYGVTLPPTVTYNLPISPLTPKLAASEKLERYLPGLHDLSDLGEDRYAKLFSKSLYDDKKKGSALQFISFSDFKPISADSDPETYKYLKALEHDNEYKIDLKHFNDDKSIDLNYLNLRDKLHSYKSHKLRDDDSEERDAYRSIQDIIDAHEANEGKQEEEDEVKEKRKKPSASKNMSKVRSLNGNGLKRPCSNGRCRKRYAPIVSRPYIRKIHYTTY